MDFPVFSEKDITNLVADVFGLDVLYTKRLDGYEDVNFHIRVALTSRNLHLSSPSEDGYVLKISSPLLSSNLDNIDAQNAMMLYLNENLHSIQVTLPVMSAKGNYREVISIPPENEASSSVDVVVRLLTFITGTTMFHVKSEPSRDVLISIGRLTGQLTQKLKGFDHPGVITAKELPWALENACDVEEKMSAVEDSTQRKVFVEVLGEFEETRKTWSDKCSRGVIFGDLNDGNIFLDEFPLCLSDTPEYYVKGLIDFADHHRSCSVFELALSVCYMMMEACRKGTVPPIEAGGLVLAGYFQTNTLSEAEKSMLKISIEARCVQTLVMGQYTFRHVYPGNSYVLNTQKGGWETLQRLRELTADELWTRWNNIISSVGLKTTTLTNGCY